MTHDQILNEALKSITRLIENEDFVNEHIEKMLKLILENYALAMQIKLMKEINERRE